MATALITGASSGIGLELANVHAAKGGDLVLVARNKEKLDALKASWESLYSIKVYTIGIDLSALDAARHVYEETTRQGIQIDYLINNAGFGDFGLFEETDWNKEYAMIQLNITTLTHLTKLYLPGMLARKMGKIMQVASTAAFQPGPTMAVYFATKAYVLSFSEALHNEVCDRGVSITALCPGATESGFQAAAALDESSLFTGRKLPTAREVAEYGYQAMLKGKSLAIHGLLNKFLVQSLRVAPRALAVQVTRHLLRKIS